MTTKKYLLSIRFIITAALFNKKLELQTFILYYKKQFYCCLILATLILSISKYSEIIKSYLKHYLGSRSV